MYISLLLPCHPCSATGGPSASFSTKTPKLPPPAPRRAHKSLPFSDFGSSVSSKVTNSPFLVASIASTRVSLRIPKLRVNEPRPAPNIKSLTPTRGHRPPLMMNPLCPPLKCLIHMAPSAASKVTILDFMLSSTFRIFRRSSKIPLKAVECLA